MSAADRSVVTMCFAGTARGMSSTAGVWTVSNPTALHSTLPTDRPIAANSVGSSLWSTLPCWAQGSGMQQRPMRLVRGDMTVQAVQAFVLSNAEGSKDERQFVLAQRDAVVVWGLFDPSSVPTGIPTSAQGIQLATMVPGEQQWDIEIPRGVQGLYCTGHWWGVITGAAITEWPDGTFYSASYAVNLTLAVGQD